MFYYYYSGTAALIPSTSSPLLPGAVVGKFAVVQVFVPVTPKWSETGEAVGSKQWLLQRSVAGWRAYCERHGYTYRLVQERLGEDQMPIHFVRFLAVAELLKTHEWVFYADVDAFVRLPARPLVHLTHARGS
ncbi:hypothetical protein CYMTET_43626 [Cymbomonas tetramitiformis]|uniref:Uncharacterized protein n=1 Tax=Cymbomonas tetramitiformis TaxID=36881 RepID=A0AAE0C3V5_9CHLO|nr:hypothetical protein CYMTET_43626 [Cymbomonas tetramitiformis]